MTDPDARRLAWVLFLLLVVFYVIAIVITVSNGSVDPFSLGTVVFPVVGIVILNRLPHQRFGWLLLGLGILVAALGLMGAYADYGFLWHPGSLPGAGVAAALNSGSWAPVIGTVGIYMLLLFPDGRPPSPRWRWVGWLGTVGILGSWALMTVFPGQLLDEFAALDNPIGIEALGRHGWILFVFIALIPISILAAAVSLVVRFRRSRGTERLQLKWLTTAAAIVATLYGLTMIASAVSNVWIGTDSTLVTVLQSLAVLSFFLIPISIGMAILRHNLYEIDVVINRALVYGSLAAFITAIYVGIVVGLGTAIGRRGNLGLSILATAVVAVGFQPVRERVQRVANRLVYGQRATPYEVLSQLSRQSSQTVATEDVLPEMARVAASATGASRVDVWLRLGDHLVREASWPPTAELVAPVPVAAWQVEGLPDDDASIPVRHQGEVLGAITARKDARESLTPADRKLLEDLASQAGLVLRNVLLIEDLRSSRQRLVQAQDEERRRLERDLHDGAQQRIVATALALRLARMQVRPEEDASVAQGLDQASEQLQLALSELRELARGIHPAILTERGLGPALAALAQRSPVPAHVETRIEGRLPAAVEATAYFVVSEALANIGKYAKASSASIAAEVADGLLELTVRDDGTGGADASKGSGLRGLSDRVAAVDGTLSIVSPPGSGTLVSVRIPVPVLAEVPA